MKDFYYFKNQKCPVCHKNKLDILQTPYEIPFFGKCMIFSTHCESCHYKNNDIISLDNHGPRKDMIEVTSSNDLNSRVVKSSTGKVIIPGIIEMIEDEGYVTNIEGIINRAKYALEGRSPQLIRMLDEVIEGKRKLKIIISDEEGNSGIISEKTNSHFKVS